MSTLLFARQYSCALILAFCLASACGGNTPPNSGETTPNTAETAAPPPEAPPAPASATEPVPSTPAPEAAPAPAAPAAPPTTLTQTELRAGTGTTAVAGKQVTVNYTGWLYDPARPDQKGQEFDSSIGREPFTFTLGARQVIPGWDRGVEGMRISGRRRLVIPPDLAYGARGAGGVIPPNATLVFDVELLKVEG